MRGARWLGYVAGAVGGALAAFGAVALAAGGTGQAAVQTTVAVVPGVVLQVTYPCGTSCSTASGTLPFGPYLGGRCEPGNAVATCAATNYALLTIQAPGATTFALSAYESAFADAAGDTMPGSALELSPCAAAGCFAQGYVYDPVSASSASPTPLWAGAALATGSTNVDIGNQVGFPETVWANVVIPAATAPGSYSNTVTLIVTAS